MWCFLSLPGTSWARLGGLFGGSGTPKSNGRLPFFGQCCGHMVYSALPNPQATSKCPPRVPKMSPKCPQDAPKWSAAGPQRPLNEDCQWYTVSLNSHFRYEPSLACSLLLLVASFIAPDVVFLVAVPVAHQCPQDVPKLTPGIPQKASN